jgi:hypothetical protein
MTLRTWLLACALALSTSAGAFAQTAPLKGDLAGIAFLVGSWDNGKGRVAETGGTSSGSSRIGVEVGGAVLLRRDHTELFGADGKPSGSFDQIMMIYPESGTLYADYSDGEHIIHYTSAVVVPGKSVTFTSDATAAGPTFRLTYETPAADTLAVRFEMKPPGATDFKLIASGTLRKSGT